MSPGASPPTADDAASSPAPFWLDLPLDLLRDISGRLHAAGDYVRFHAVCRPWRDALPPPTSRPAFLPWLLALRYGTTGHQTARCVLSSRNSSSRRAAGAGAVDIHAGNRRWVIGADGGGAWLLDASSPESSCLVNPLTASAVAALPPFSEAIRPWVERAVGTVSGDGTIFLYWSNVLISAALLRPGGAAWAPVPTDCSSLPVLYTHDADSGGVVVAYHDGRIILRRYESPWYILPVSVQADVAVTSDHRRARDAPCDFEHWTRTTRSVHLVESRGELLAVFVVRLDTREPRAGDVDSLASALRVSVYALQEADRGGQPRWARRHGRSLADRVLFLGRPTSFAVDAARLGVDGGCAYFVDRRLLYDGAWSKPPLEQCRVFRYSFVDETSEFVEQLPAEWTAKEGCLWITPQPAMASTKEIRERVQAVNRMAAKHQGQFGADFRIYVGNLPRKVDCYRLQQFFSKHGKVSDARVMCDKGTGRSRGFGFVTIAVAMDDDRADLIARLRGQKLDGRSMRMKLVDQEP